MPALETRPTKMKASFDFSSVSQKHDNSADYYTGMHRYLLSI
jgi:hypothetical protein